MCGGGGCPHRPALRFRAFASGVVVVVVAAAAAAAAADRALTLNILVAVVNSLSTKTHSSKKMTELCFENADVTSIWYCKQRVKSTLSFSSDCVETKLCKPCTSFASQLHSSCGMVWYRP